MAIKRVSCGIEELDKHLQGGLPEGSITLVSGPAGAGKSLFGLQFLFKNSELKSKEGAYFSFEERPQDLLEEAAEIGLDFKKRDNIVFKRLSPFTYESVIDEMRAVLKKKQTKVAVLDSVSTLASFSASYTTVLPDILKDEECKVLLTPEFKLGGEAAVKALMLDLTNLFKKYGVTALWLSELPKEFLYYSRDTESEFLADGIILLNRLSSAQSPTRLLTIEKMRKTNHSLARFPFVITNRGLTIKSPSDFYKA